MPLNWLFLSGLQITWPGEDIHAFLNWLTALQRTFYKPRFVINMVSVSEEKASSSIPGACVGACNSWRFGTNGSGTLKQAARQHP